MKAIPALIVFVAGAMVSTTCSPKQTTAAVAPQSSTSPPVEAAASTETHGGWTTDMEKAFKKAKAENKSVLVEFTGSDWCPPCIAMRKNVFTKNEFITKVSKDFVLVELDFPNGNAATKEKNQPYAEKYSIEGFPTVILFSPEGKEFTRFYASEYPTIDLFTKHLEGALEKKDLN
jgi:thiol:disulfide interchange protein